MSDTPTIRPGTKASRLAAALSRVAFWSLWARETDEPGPKAYFGKRLRHWEHARNAVEMEPDPEPKDEPS